MALPSRKKIKLMNQTTSGSSESFRCEVQLFCTTSNQTEKGDLTFQESLPQDILCIKKQVELKFSIPVCVQVVSYNGYPLNDKTKLLALRVRMGDTFQVKYLAKGDCKDISNTISWLQQVCDAIASGTSDLAEVIEHGLDESYLENLQQAFSPWENTRTYVNKLFFVDNEGVDKLLIMYRFLLQTEWNEMSEDFKFSECWIIRSLWSFEETFPLRRLLTRQNIIEMLTRSLLRVRLEEGRNIYEYDTSGSQFEGDLLVATICSSIGALMNLTEVPECRLEIASNKELLGQISCVTTAPTLATRSSHIVASLFSNLASTPAAHPYIADSLHINRLFQACETFPKDSTDLLLLEYFIFLFLIQVSLDSVHCLKPDQHSYIAGRMELFLQANSYLKVRNAEIQKCYNCSIFIPYVKLAYVPNTPQVGETEISKLQLLSIRFAIFTLQNWLGRENHRKILLKEGLLDYVVCMPQYVPTSLKSQAEELVQVIVSSPDIPEGPPKLLSLVKAKLAKVHFGLEQVLSLSVSEIVSSTQ